MAFPQLEMLRKSIELWFRSEPNDAAVGANNFESIQAICVEILLHGLQLGTNLRIEENVATAAADNHATLKLLNETETDANALRKLIEDFEFVRRSAQIHETLPTATVVAHSKQSSLSRQSSCGLSEPKSAAEFLQAWVLRNLKANCLCACLQALVADRELLECRYRADAFVRNERYATALFICLSALELNRCSLLSQIETELYSLPLPMIAKHKRSNSHPNFSISPPKKLTMLSQGNDDGESAVSRESTIVASTPQRSFAKPVFPAFRKTKSLPLILSEPPTVPSTTKARPRSKTMSTTKAVAAALTPTATQPKNIPKASSFVQQRLSEHNIATAACSSNASSSYSGGEDMQPSTSAGSRKSQSTFTLRSNSTNTSSATSSSSVSSTNSTTTTRRIQLIKCDDIKIWTDPNWELQQEQKTPERSTEARTVLQNTLQNTLNVKQTKSISPMNSFLSSLFSTPPAYTTWSLNQHQCANSTQWDAADSTTVYSTPQLSNTSGGVFDAFLPIYGKKLRSRKSQNLFEDGISTLDYSDYSSTTTCISAKQPSESSTTTEAGTISGTTTPKNCQSLTAFLQTSQLSRNNTELERENAHFRISEAIISAIEHIKWAKLEPDKQRREPAAAATDWLEGDHQRSSCHESSPAYDINEHIPYAEVGETCLDLPSAEVVGLSLISKFNDKHLPKVSELKWLVSEDDTPQQLLPMPDSSPTANPDENIIPSMTRGTKYWAPPRQQIIFTDHPSPNRRQLLQKQNNRCAGCGMRVSPQYIHCFRYCTYFGKFHCTGCHRNQISATPAKILQSWNFKCYPVSVFAYRLLEQMYTYPLFYVPDLNPALYVRSKALLEARTKRIQLKFVKDFIRACRFAAGEQKYFDVMPEHITIDPDSWSMSDFIDANNKSMQRSIEELIEKCENHIFNCVLCTARGFLCECCKKDHVIYPWESKTFRCDRCGSCFHLNCWKAISEICCKCQRLNKRKDEEDI